jgi:hypothetical protein
MNIETTVEVLEAKESAKRFLVVLETMKTNNIRLSKEKTCNYRRLRTLTNTIKYQSSLYLAINCYLKSKYYELGALKAIVNIDLNDRCVMKMYKVEVYLNCIMQIQVAKDLIKKINNNKLTDTYNEVLKRAKDLLSKKIDIEDPSSNMHYLTSIEELNSNLKAI